MMTSRIRARHSENQDENEENEQARHHRGEEVAPRNLSNDLEEADRAVEKGPNHKCFTQIAKCICKCI